MSLGPGLPCVVLNLVDALTRGKAKGIDPHHKKGSASEGQENADENLHKQEDTRYFDTEWVENSWLHGTWLSRPRIKGLGRG